MRVMLFAVLSAFACGGGHPDPSSTILVSVQFAGEFDDVAVASDPPGISCSQNRARGVSACAAAFPRGTAVRLRAASCTCAFQFEGACSAQNDCMLDGRSDARVTVVVQSFCSKRMISNLTTSTSGRGRITMGNVPIDCGPICSACMSGRTVLVAQPDPGATFLGWGGACSGTGDCTFLPQQGLHVSAAFSP